MEKKCKMCGQTIIRTDMENFCCQKCAYEYKSIKQNLQGVLKRIAKKYDFKIENMDKIVNAKMMLFGRYHDNVRKCPCDANNPERFCGSARCIADTVNDGQCHCGLFHRS